EHRLRWRCRHAAQHGRGEFARRQWVEVRRCCGGNALPPVTDAVAVADLAGTSGCGRRRRWRRCAWRAKRRPVCGWDNTRPAQSIGPKQSRHVERSHTLLRLRSEVQWRLRWIDSLRGRISWRGRTERRGGHQRSEGTRPANHRRTFCTGDGRAGRELRRHCAGRRFVRCRRTAWRKLALIARLRTRAALLARRHSQWLELRQRRYRFAGMMILEQMPHRIEWCPVGAAVNLDMRVELTAPRADIALRADLLRRLNRISRFHGPCLSVEDFNNITRRFEMDRI